MTVVTPRSGFDLEYYLNRATGEKTAGGYYLNAAQQGEPPGRWFGKGAEALGFTDGQQVERDPYLAVYQQVDPRTGETFGRGPYGYKHYTQILANKLAAEPLLRGGSWLRPSSNLKCRATAAAARPHARQRGAPG